MASTLEGNKTPQIVLKPPNSVVGVGATAMFLLVCVLLGVLVFMIYSFGGHPSRVIIEQMPTDVAPVMPGTRLELEPGHPPGRGLQRK